MRFGVGVITQSLRRVGILFTGAMVFVAFASLNVVHAESTKVQASVNSGTLHPTLVLSGISSPVTVDAMPLHLAGTVDSLTQIQVYVDGEYSVAIPLDAGATTFSYDFVMPTGSHAVKLVGISPFVDISPTVELSVTYAPPNQQPSDGSNLPGTGSSTTGGGIIISRDATSDSSTTYVASPAKTSLPTWLYNGLVAVDILPKNDDAKGTELAKSVQRFSLATTGMLFLVYAHPMFLLYHQVRYTWLGFHTRRVPDFLRRHPIGYIRTAGALLIFSVFSLI